METIPRVVQDPAWWFTVVLFGLLVNIAAAYLKPLLEKVGRRLRSGASAIARDHSRRMEWEVASAKSDVSYQIATQLLKIEYLIKIIGSVVLAIYLSHLASDPHGDPLWSRLRSLMSSVAGWYAAISLGRYWRFSETLLRAWRAAKANEKKRE